MQTTLMAKHDAAEIVRRFESSTITLHEIERLREVRDAARALTEECRGDHPPSLGALARLESALYVEWADAAALTEGKR